MSATGGRQPARARAAEIEAERLRGILNAADPAAKRVVAAILQDKATNVAEKDEVSAELLWMKIGAPPLTQAGLRTALAAHKDDLTVPVPTRFYERLLKAAALRAGEGKTARARPIGKGGTIKRVPRRRPRPSRLAFLIWLTVARQPRVTWQAAATIWLDLTEEWSRWLIGGRRGRAGGLSTHPEAQFAHAEWVEEYGRIAGPGAGVESLDGEDIREMVAKRSGPSLLQPE